MVVTRELDAEFVNLQRQGELALFASCRGQEAAQIGVGGVPAQDRLAVSAVPRDSARSCCAASRPRRWARSGGAAGTAGSASPTSAVAPIAIPIGTHGLHAVGAAMAAQRLGEDSVTVAFLGDGATQRGRRPRGAEPRRRVRAPCVFFVQNNQWAISVPVSRQQAGPSIAHRAIGYGMPGVRVDGNDVLACYAVMAEAAERARAGGGPTLIEAVTYRMGPHTTSDDPTRYQPRRRGRAVGARGIPIDRYRTYLQTTGVWTERLRASASQRGRRGCAPNCATRSSTHPTWTSARCSTPSMTRSPRTLHSQRDQLMAELAKEA